MLKLRKSAAASAVGGGGQARPLNEQHNLNRRVQRCKLAAHAAPF